MFVFIRCIRSDFYKFRHTYMFLIHILLPLGAAAAFLTYYTVSPWEPTGKISGYVEVIGVAFPLIIGLVCSKAIEQEGQAGSFQNMLCNIKSRALIYLSKLLVMIFLGAFSILVAISVFAFGFKNAPALFYGKIAVLLVTGGLFLYILHLFISLQYGRGASVGLGIVESLISALALTGLGDKVWYYFPCAWSARFGDNLVYELLNPGKTLGYAEIQKGLTFAIPATMIAFALSLLWFRIWEGRKSYD